MWFQWSVTECAFPCWVLCCQAEGYVIGSCIKHIPLAGRDITGFVQVAFVCAEILRHQRFIRNWCEIVVSLYLLRIRWRLPREWKKCTGVRLEIVFTLMFLYNRTAMCAPILSKNSTSMTKNQKSISAHIKVNLKTIVSPLTLFILFRCSNANEEGMGSRFFELKKYWIL